MKAELKAAELNRAEVTGTPFKLRAHFKKQSQAAMHCDTIHYQLPTTVG